VNETMQNVFAQQSQTSRNALIVAKKKPL